MQELKRLKAWVTPYEGLRQRLGAAVEMAQLLEQEPDQSMETEVGHEADELSSAVEAFELQAMLQGPDDARDAHRGLRSRHGG